MSRRTRRARAIRYNERSSAVVTDITLWDHVLLLDRLKSRPVEVLSEFKAAGIHCLAELEMFRLLWVTNRKAAETIALVASRMDIPIHAVPLSPEGVTG